MRTRNPWLLAAAGLFLAGSQIMVAQDQQAQPPRPAPPQMRPPPAEGNAPPPILYIENELAKPGNIGDHTKVVSDVIHLYDRQGWPLRALGMSGVTSLEGEVVFLVAFDSFAAIDKLEEQVGKSPKAALDELRRLESQESALHVWKQTMLAAYRPDLSYRPDANAFAKATLVYTNQHLVRFGHEAEYESDVHFLADAFAKANVDRSWFVYQVISGAPTGTFIRLEPLRSFADWDAWPEKVKAVTAALDDAGRKRLEELWKDSTVQATGDMATPLTRLYALRPDMSRVSDRFAAENPGFWRPKPPPAEKPAANPSAKPKAK